MSCLSPHQIDHRPRTTAVGASFALIPPKALRSLLCARHQKITYDRKALKIVRTVGRGAMMTDKETREQATRHFFTRAQRQVKEG